MDPAPAKNAPRRVKFAPKAPPQRRAKSLPKVEKVEEEFDVAHAEEILRQFNEVYVKGKPKAERKVGPAQVAFRQVGSATHTRSYGGPSAGSVYRPPVEKEYQEPWEFGEAAESLAYEESFTYTGFDLGLMVMWGDPISQL